MSEPLVIIGNGMAAARLCEELAQRALGRYAIALIGEEPRLAYNRVLLSSVLAGDVSANDIALKTASWWSDRGVTLCYGAGVTAADIGGAQRHARRRQAIAVRQARLRHRLARDPLADTGAALRGVLTFRDMADVASMTRAAASRRARRRHRRRPPRYRSRLRSRQGRRSRDARSSDGPADGTPARRPRRRAARARARSQGHRGDARSGRPRISSATIMSRRSRSRMAASSPPDLAVVAVGITPNAEIAKAAGLAVKRGIIVDDHLVDHHGRRVRDRRMRRTPRRLLRPGRARQRAGPRARRAPRRTRRLLPRQRQRHQSESLRRQRVLGRRFSRRTRHRGHRLQRSGLGCYRKLVVADGRLAGAVLYGDTADALWYLDLIRSGAAIEYFRDDLIFGRALAERAVNGSRCASGARHERSAASSAGRAHHLPLLRRRLRRARGAGRQWRRHDLGRSGPSGEFRTAVLEGLGARRNAVARRAPVASDAAAGRRFARARRLGHGARQGRRRIARHHRPRRAGRDRVLSVRPIADRRLLRRQQADERLSRLAATSTPIRACAWPPRSPAIAAPSAPTPCPAPIRTSTKPISSCWSAPTRRGAIRCFISA